ncbi:MAG: replicative DNA helicase [Microcoleaceae cyanobacterium]
MANEPNFSASPDRLPPQNIEAEEAILGGLLLDPEAIGRVAELLKAENFAVLAHQIIYQATLTLYLQGKPTDLMTVTSWLADQNQLEKVGGQGKLAQLVERTISAINIDQYSHLVVDKSFRRQLIKAGAGVMDLGYQTELELEEVLDKSEQLLLNLTQVRPQQALVPIGETLINTFQDIEDRNEGITLPGIPCGFYDLDAMTGGFQRSDLIIVAGRPSMGKCLSYDAEIVLADGSIATIQEIYQAKTAELLTLKYNLKFERTQPSAFIDDGIKPVFKITTKLGRTIESTLTHPFLTQPGWQPLSQLKIGDKIAVPRIINIFGIQELSLDEIKAIARNSCDKLLPQIIFKLKRSQIAFFLNQYFAIQGIITVNQSHQFQIKSKSNNQKYLQQIQHLLLRFGIISAIKFYHKSWKLEVTETDSIHQFISEIGCISKKYNLLSYKDNNKVRQESVSQFVSFDRTNTIEKSNSLTATALQEKTSYPLTESEIYWDEIVSIECMGFKQVYDLTIPETHNFVANDICVHNTSFAVGIAHNIAKTQGLSTAIYSLEMSKEQLVQRLLSSESRIESNRLRSGRISQAEWEPLTMAIGTLSELSIFIDDTPNITVTEMRSKARRLQAEQGGELGLVLIDYLQLMEGSSDNRVQELSRITRALKGMARELNVPVIALSQLSRGVEARTNKRPMMSDLRESGSIEQDADLVIMLYRDDYYNPDTPDRGISEIIITKHRNGPTGTVKLLFDPQFTRFRNLAASERYSFPKNPPNQLPQG